MTKIQFVAPLSHMTADARLRSLLSISKQPREIEIHSCPQSVTVAFVQAEQQLGSLAYLPTATIHATIVQERLITEAIFKATGSINQPKMDDPRLQEIAQFANESLSSHDGSVDHQAIMRDAASRWEQSSEASALSGAWQAYMSAIISTAWTTFEILSGDLWETALNCHPHVLSELTGRRSRISDLVYSKSPKHSENTSAINDKTIPLQLVQMYSYNLENNMGSILKRSQSFDKLDGIRSAYSQAFSMDSSDIDSILARPLIDAISLIRNLLVHRGGRIDDTYIKKSRKFDICPKGDAGTMIFLNGKMVSEMVIGIIDAGYDLISQVDRWAMDHPNKMREATD